MGRPSVQWTLRAKCRGNEVPRPLIASGEAPRLPIAGTSVASPRKNKLQADLLFSDDAIALRSMHVFSKFFFPTPARPGGPQEMWDVSYSSWVAISGWPKCIPIDGGGS